VGFSLPDFQTDGSPALQASALYTENMDMPEATDENDMTAEDNSVEITNDENPFEDSE